MYASNVFSKRRASGWVERRRRFDRLAENAQQARAKAGKPGNRREDASDKPKS